MIQSITVLKVSKCEVFCDSYFLVFDTITRKYGPEKTWYLNTFHEVHRIRIEAGKPRKILTFYKF